MFRRSAAPQPRLHRGRAEPGRHLQRSRQVRRGQGDLRARDGHRAAGRRASSTRSSKARSPTCTPRSAPPTAPSPRSTRRSTSTERALALCPTFVDIRTELGKTLREMGDLPAPIRELEQVRAENPRYPLGRIHLGLSYHAAGRHDDAAAQWKAVLEAEPDNRSAKMYLAMLEATPAAPAPAAPPK